MVALSEVTVRRQAEEIIALKGSIGRLLDCYWGEGDGEPPPKFIKEAVRLSGWEHTPARCKRIPAAPNADPISQLNDNTLRMYLGENAIDVLDGKIHDTKGMIGMIFAGVDTETWELNFGAENLHGLLSAVHDNIKTMKGAFAALLGREEDGNA